MTQPHYAKRGPIRGCVARRRPITASALKRLNAVKLDGPLYAGHVRMNDLQMLLGSYERCDVLARELRRLLQEEQSAPHSD